MPELPEVEHARRRLARAWTGRTVVQADPLDPAAVRTGLSSTPADALPDGAAWFASWEGRRIDGLERRGKRFGFHVGELGVVAHLGMTGRWIRRDGVSEVRHARLRIGLDDGSQWWFEDMRRFGCVAPASPSVLDALCRGLGPDALVDVPTGEVLRERLGVGRAAIKVRLMDQARLAGVGNIQATEALWHAGIHPAKRASDVQRWTELADGIQWTLARTLQDAGDEELVYLSQDKDNNPFLVYGRVGSSCTRCESLIESTRLSGRVSPFCPTCQSAT